MQCSVMPEVLRPELTRAWRIVHGAKAAAGVASCVELSASDGHLHLRVRDEHVGFVSRVPADVSAVGTLLIDCSRLQAVLDVRPDGSTMRLQKSGAFLHVQQGEFFAKVPILRSGSMGAIDFDLPYDVDTLVSTDVLEGMRSCMASVDDEQGTFTGMLLDFTEPGILRVASFTRALLQIAHFDVSPVVACRAVLAPRILTVLTSMPAEPFRLALSLAFGRAFIFSSSFAVSVACVQDRFPVAYQHVLGLYRWREGVYPVPVLDGTLRVVSELGRSQIVLNREEALAALHSVRVVLEKEDQTIAMHVGAQLSDGRLVVEFVGENLMTKSKATEKVLATGIISAAVSIGLNHPSVIAAIRRLRGDECVLHVGRKEDAVVITEKNHPNVVALSTPMRL